MKGHSNRLAALERVRTQWDNPLVVLAVSSSGDTRFQSPDVLYGRPSYEYSASELDSLAMRRNIIVLSFPETKSFPEAKTIALDWGDT